MLNTIRAVMCRNKKIELLEPVDVPAGTEILVTILPDSEEMEWLKAASRNEAFDFLKDPEEDIYTPSDGRPFHDPI